MSAIPYDSREEEWEETYGGEEHQALPGRPRRRWLTPASAALAALLLGVVGFYAGVRVEKGQVSSGSATVTGSSLASTFASRSGGAPAGGLARTAGVRGLGRFGGGLAAAFGGGANSTFGTVSSVTGNTIYVTDSSGNTVKVDLVSATKVTKSVGVPKSSIRPGDMVVVQGLRSGATVTAASVSDTGPSASRAAGAGAAGSGAGSSGAAAVNSLFNGG